MDANVQEPFLTLISIILKMKPKVKNYFLVSRRNLSYPALSCSQVCYLFLPSYPIYMRGTRLLPILLSMLYQCP